LEVIRTYYSFINLEEILLLKQDVIQNSSCSVIDLNPSYKLTEAVRVNQNEKIIIQEINKYTELTNLDLKEFIELNIRSISCFVLKHSNKENNKMIIISSVSSNYNIKAKSISLLIEAYSHSISRHIYNSITKVRT